MTRRLAFGALAVAATVVAIIVATGGGDQYTLRLDLANASGLKDGSPVVMSGVTRGQVKLHLAKDDRIAAELKLDRAVAPVGRNVRVAITAANFLGQKRVELERGTAAPPAPSGFVVPAAQVTTPTDLDQVLNVLDADTRTRAMILLDELGTAVIGRKTDINSLLRQFPRGFVDATEVLRQVQSDNHSLRDLVTHSDRFVGEATARRTDLVRMIDVLGQTSQTVSAKRAELRTTLARAPQTLRTLQAFLADLQATTKPLAPAASAIAAAAPALSQTLAQVEPFTAAARPTLAEAQTVAPQLTKLGEKATPVLEQALPTATSLATLSAALPPVGKTLDKSADNIIAILENWSRAIQFRDALGHVFRGEASYSTDLLTTMMDRLVRPSDKKPKAKVKAPATPPAAPHVDLPKPVKKVVDALPKKVKDAIGGLVGGTQQKLDETTKKLQDALGQILSGGGNGAGAKQKDASKSLLDFLLGS